MKNLHQTGCSVCESNWDGIATVSLFCLQAFCSQAVGRGLVSLKPPSTQLAKKLSEVEQLRDRIHLLTTTLRVAGEPLFFFIFVARKHVSLVIALALARNPRTVGLATDAWNREPAGFELLALLRRKRM